MLPKVDYSDYVEPKNPQKTFTCKFCGGKITFSVSGNYQSVKIKCKTCSKIIKISKEEVEKI